MIYSAARRPWPAAGPRTRWPGGPRPSAATPEQLRVQGLAGSPAEIADKLGQFAELGTQTMYLQVMDLPTWITWSCWPS